MSADERDSLPSSNANVDSRSRLSNIFKKAVGRTKGTNLKSSNNKFTQSLTVGSVNGRYDSGCSDCDNSVNSFDLETCVNIIESINNIEGLTDEQRNAIHCLRSFSSASASTRSSDRRHFNRRGSMVGSHFTDEISKCIQEMANNVQDEDQHRNVADVLATYGGRISQLKLLKHTDPGHCGEKITTQPHEDSAAESSARDRRLSIRRGAFVNKDTSMLIPKGHERTPSIMELRDEVDYLEKEAKVYCPPEWNALNSKTRMELTRILSWDNLARWDFNIQTVTELSKDTMKVSSSAGYNYGQCCPLLLVGWAILCAPMAQQAMEGSLGSSDSVVRPSCSDQGDAFPYPFFDLKINPERVCNFLREVESRYDPELPYHNNIHAADVTQTLHCLLQMIGKENLYAIYEPVDIFSVLLAATFHDVGHPGLNNLYHKNARLELAILYNDSSILENMHSAVGQSLLLGEEKQTKWDIFQPWDCTQIDRARSVMIGAVLGTDMGNHFESVGKLADLVEKLRTSETFSFVSSLNSTSSGAKQVVPILTILAGILDSETTNPRDVSQGMMRTVEMLSSRQKEKASTPQERESREKECTHLADFILKFLVHAADISNPAKKVELSDYWTDRVYEEFFAQGRYCLYLALFGRVSSSDSSHVSMNFPLSTGDKEKELGLPISPLCDRDTVKKVDSQIGFLKFVVRPTYLLLGAILPKVVNEVVMPSIDEQIRYWGQKKAKLLLQDGLSNVKVMSGVIQSLSSYRLEN